MRNTVCQLTENCIEAHFKYAKCGSNNKDCAPNTEFQSEDETDESLKVEEEEEEE